MPARRKSVTRREAPKAARRAKTTTKRKATTRKPAARKQPVANSLEAVARRIVEATIKPEKFVIKDLYTTDCISQEAAGEPAVGHAGLELKLKRWEAMQKGTTWRARSVALGKNLICIEWDAKVTMNDGRVVPLPEVAIHEIRGGKIARERFYYNPTALMPASS